MLQESTITPLAIHIYDTSKVKEEKCELCAEVIDKRKGVYRRNGNSYCVDCYENNYGLTQ